MQDNKGFSYDSRDLNASASRLVDSAALNAFCLGVLLLLSVGCVDAATKREHHLPLGKPTPGFVYFNKLNATLELHKQDLEDCRRKAASVRTVDDIMSHGHEYKGLLGEYLVATWSAGLVPSAVENCMVVKGWQVIRLPAAQGKALAQLKREDLARQLEPWIGATAPPGELARRWNNDAARASTDRANVWPGANGNVSLSIGIMDQKDEKFERPKDVHLEAAHVLDKKSLSSIPAEAALVLFQIKGGSYEHGSSLAFTLMQSGTDEIVEGSKKHPNLFGVGVGFAVAHKAGDWFAYAVPAGRLQMTGLDFISFCLGAPAFDVSPGEVIYAGSFNLGANDLGPNLDLQPAKEWLSERGVSTETLRAASYTNGWISSCGGSSIYAIEVTGAPFRENYRWGSRAGTEVP
jgi:hypothetical protein